MKLSKKLEEALQKQVTLEYNAAYVYNGMRIYLDDAQYAGASSWMTKQAKEELEHAEAFINFLDSLDVKAELGKIEEEKTEYDDLLSVLEAALDHEKMITESIEDILKIAIKDEHFAAENFLRKFIDEQVEEEDNFRGLIDLVKFAGDDKAALLKIDSILGER